MFPDIELSPQAVRDKRLRREAMAERAFTRLAQWLAAMGCSDGSKGAAMAVALPSSP
jgi:hypothetical protein